MTTDPEQEDKQIQNYIGLKLQEKDALTKNIDIEFNRDKQKLDNIVKEKVDAINAHMKDIKKYSNKLNSGPDQIANQENIMLEKNNIITTRLLMLENTRRRNAYKKKLVYITITIIITVLLIMIAAYVYSNKKYIVKNFNKNNSGK